MVTLGTGVGGGVVLNGKVLMGESGVAGEIGHMTVNPFETVRCNCGKMGCLEQYASATGMVRVAKQVLAKRREDSLLRQKEVTAKTLWDAARAGDALANEITDAVSAYLGMALANAMYLSSWTGQPAASAKSRKSLQEQGFCAQQRKGVPFGKAGQCRRDARCGGIVATENQIEACK